MKKFSAREKAMVFILILLLVAMGVKSLVFDPYSYKNEEEEEVARLFINDRKVPDGFFIQGRLVKMEKVEKETHGQVLTYGYKLTFRDYFFRIFPFRQWSVLL